MKTWTVYQLMKIQYAGWNVLRETQVLSISELSFANGLQVNWLGLWKLFVRILTLYFQGFWTGRVHLTSIFPCTPVLDKIGLDVSPTLPLASSVKTSEHRYVSVFYFMVLKPFCYRYCHHLTMSIKHLKHLIEYNMKKVQITYTIVSKHCCL